MVFSSAQMGSGTWTSRNCSQSPDTDTLIGRVNALGMDSFRLANSTVQKSKVTINELALGLKSDLSKTALGEIGEITDQFLKYTDLETALAMLRDLAQMVEDLLRGHTYLRVNGPQLSSALDKLDSILKMSGHILSAELAAVRSDCRNSLLLPQSLEKFDKLVTRLERGLHDRSSSTRTFFEEFRLESSLGLFNMLGLLPFNVSEVLEQLQGAAKMRVELETSLRQKTQNLFASLPLPRNPNDTDWLNPYFTGIETALEEASSKFHQGVEGDLRRAWRSKFIAECSIYFLALFSLALPLCLLIVRSVHCRTAGTPDLPRAPSTSQTTDLTSTRSDRSLTDTLSSVLKKLSADPASPQPTCRGPAEVISSPNVATAVAAITSEEESSGSDSGLSDAKQNSAERVKLLSKSECSMSGSVTQIALPIASEEPDCLKLLPSVHVSPGLWSRTDTLDSVTRKRRRGGNAYCDRRRLWTAVAYVITCLCLCLLTFTASFLAVSTGLLQITICLPLSDDTHRQSLDEELNGITNRNWDFWMNDLREFVLSMLPVQVKAMSSAATQSELGFRNILRIEQPRNLITTILQTCAAQSYDGSLYDVGLIQAMGVTVHHNFSGLFDLTLVQESSNNIKTVFQREAVQLIEQKLQEGLLPANFELLLNTLKEEEASGARAAARGGEVDSSVLYTAERFWRQSTEGAAERLEALNSSLARFRHTGDLLKRLHTLQQKLIEEGNSATAGLAFQPAGPHHQSCFTRLTNLPHLIDFNSRLIASARRDFPAHLGSQELIKAASDLARVSRQPPFTKTLTEFANLAFKLGLSVSSSKAAKKALVARVHLVTGHEYDRLVRKFLTALGASIFDARVNAALGQVLRPCTEVSRIAEAALTTVCPVKGAGMPTFVPILLRLSLLAFLLTLFVLASQTFLLFWGCLSAVSVCFRTEHERDKP